MLSRESLMQFMRYCMVGSFNFLVNVALFNALLFSTGIKKGPYVTLFAVISFAIVATQSFFLNVMWTFRDAPADVRHVQYVRFIAVSGTTALINILLIHVLVSDVGAPEGITPLLWANIALVCTVLISIIGNFIGYKMLVFRGKNLA